MPISLDEAFAQAEALSNAAPGPKPRLMLQTTDGYLLVESTRPSLVQPRQEAIGDFRFLYIRPDQGGPAFTMLEHPLGRNGPMKIWPYRIRQELAVSGSGFSRRIRRRYVFEAIPGLVEPAVSPSTLDLELLPAAIGLGNLRGYVGAEDQSPRPPRRFTYKVTIGFKPQQVVPGG